MILQIFSIVLLLVIGVSIVTLILCLYDREFWIFGEDYWIYKYGRHHPAVRQQLENFENNISYLKNRVHENEKVINQLQEELDAHAARLDKIEKELNQLRGGLSLGGHTND